MKVLVTGGAGFIGSHIVDELLANNIETVIVDNLSTGKRENIPKNVPFYQLDIQSSMLERVFLKEKPTYVIHQAAQVDVVKSIQNPAFDADTNIVGTVNLLNYCQRFDVQKFIYASSCAVYGETNDCSIQEDFPIRPISFYGASKYTPELYIRLYNELYNLPFMILRYANVYGPRQTPKGEGGVVSIFITKLLNNETPVIFGDGKQTRDFVFVKDVAFANRLSLFHGKNEVVNIGCNSKTNVNELYQIILEKLKLSVEPTFKPKRAGDILYSRLDNEKAKNIIAWSPKTNISDGIEQTISY